MSTPRDKGRADSGCNPPNSLNIYSACRAGTILAGGKEQSAANIANIRKGWDAASGQNRASASRVSFSQAL